MYCTNRWHDTKTHQMHVFIIPKDFACAIPQVPQAPNQYPPVWARPLPNESGVALRGRCQLRIETRADKQGLCDPKPLGRWNWRLQTIVAPNVQVFDISEPWIRYLELNVIQDSYSRSAKYMRGTWNVYNPACDMVGRR